MKRYWLAPHAFVSLSGEFAVILDLRSDRYWLAEPADTAELAACVEGWPTPTSAALRAKVPAEGLPAPDKVLCDRGLLTEDEASGKSACPPVLPTQTASLLDRLEESLPSVNLWRWFWFLSAAIRAAFYLRVQTFERVTMSVEAARHSGGDTDTADSSRAAALVAAYSLMRTLVFTANDSCVFDCLTLLLFLRHYHIHPRWVFGVQAAPFAAHCWLQQEALVFNDIPDHVRRFSPIMVC